MPRLSGAFVLALALSTAGADKVYASYSVEELTQDNFDKRVDEEDIMLVKFFAPWCGHCKAMAPAYEEASVALAKADPAVPIGQVDCTEDKEICERSGVQGYPTLKIFRKGEISDYPGGRTADSIVKTMLKEALGVSGEVPDDSEVQGATFMAKACRGGFCNDPKYPIIDYDEEKGECVCTAHPCWNDDGKHHSCSAGDYPHLYYSYTKEGKLQCGCRAKPHYNSPYIVKVKCGGAHCEEGEHSELDWDADQGQCVCRKHPCEDLDGQKHSCSDPKFPMLKYREEKTPDGGVKKICECAMGLGQQTGHGGEL